MKLILLAIGMLIGSLTHAASGQYQGINLDAGNALQMNLCALKPGKTMANYNRVMDDYIEWSRENDVEIFVLRLTPMFLSANPNGAPQFEFIDMLISNFDTSGSSWTKWLTGADGQKINAQWLETADCRVSLNAAYIMVLDREALSAREDRVMTFNWCTRNDGVSTDALRAKHQELAADWTPENPVKAWTIMVPSLGSRNTPGAFAHLLSFEDANGLMAWQNATANDEGWRDRQDYENSYADCVGDNAYYAQVLNRPGS